MSYNAQEVQDWAHEEMAQKEATRQGMDAVLEYTRGEAEKVAAAIKQFAEGLPGIVAGVALNTCGISATSVFIPAGRRLAVFALSLLRLRIVEGVGSGGA
ncbi:MAG: hypothetical protein ACYC0L_05600 [Thermoleophilia bacterium]